MIILKGKMRNISAFFCALVVSLLSSGCANSSISRMKVEEVFYVAVASGENTNYFRVTIKGESVLGVAAYESGWFPGTAVDRLYGAGNINDAKSQLADEKIKAAFDDAYVKAYQTYMAVAENPATSDEEIAKYLLVLKRIRAVPGDGTPLPEGAKEIEYDPVSNLTLLHSGEKFVIAFSSNPDAVLNGIKSAAQSDETSKAILKLSELAKGQDDAESARLTKEKQNLERFASLLSARLATTAALLAEKPESGSDKAVTAQQLDQLRTEVESLVTLTESSL